ncbi:MULTISPECIES: response regulator transcription factor [unclassified Hyphomicrobium]|uniref:response regulator transcription factor n=1 Tax=unclassified Hyphomicrobium TaxID=2619925 RepID=UPI000213E1A0|nr:MULTISPECIES: response regulator transcription factor [unclassified Hyphomicrobium]CCB65216.1 putative DNA-binding response regulator in two-component regulatory system [Hyphomicrobium sp. MC1]
MRILIVEDEPKIAKSLATALTAANYSVDAVHDGEDAWFRGDTENYDLVILDLGLPKIDGLSVLKRWRAAGRMMPVLVLTARGAWMERVEGIDAGADDYLVKPFQIEELIARVRALIRRSVGQGSALLTAGKLSVDTRQMRVLIDGASVAVSPLEYRLISYLIHHKGRVIPPAELIEHLYGDDDARDANALEAVVTRLRKKLGQDLIETRRGFGYTVMEVPA